MLKSKDSFSVQKHNLDDSPLVTVYMPTHNRSQLLRRAVDSVLAQSYQNFELIIVDDGSCDDTADYLKVLAESEPRVRYFRQKVAKGACIARNIAIREARGKFITGLDDDDEFLPNRLEMLLLNYDEKYAFICQGAFWHYGAYKTAIDNAQMIINLEQMLDYNYATNQVFTETSRLQSIGGFNPDFPACQDYDTWVRLLLKFGQGKRISGASYIIHQGHEGPRIISKKNMLNGYAKFYSKYSGMMTKRNKINHQNLVLISSRARFTLSDFLKSIFYGLIRRKVRYFLSSNFRFISKWRSKHLRGKPFSE